MYLLTPSSLRAGRAGLSWPIFDLVRHSHQWFSARAFHWLSHHCLLRLTRQRLLGRRRLLSLPPPFDPRRYSATRAPALPGLGGKWLARQELANVPTWPAIDGAQPSVCVRLHFLQVANLLGAPRINAADAGTETDAKRGCRGTLTNASSVSSSRFVEAYDGKRRRFAGCSTA